ncbi:unnamed protein product [Cochlearia groenlandica]
MVKFATLIITFIVTTLVLFAVFEAPTMVEAQRLCPVPSGTFIGVCDNTKCHNTCVYREGARLGSCIYVFPIYKCFCYFLC